MWCCVIGEVKQKFGVKRVNDSELKKQRRQRQRKRHLKINILEMVTILLFLPLPRIPFDRARGKQTGGSAFEVNLENERFAVVFPRCRWNLKFGNFTLSLADYVKELNQSECRTCSTFIFPHSTNQSIAFWRRRCRCRRPCLSSLMVKLPPWQDTYVQDCK